MNFNNCIINYWNRKEWKENGETEHDEKKRENITQIDKNRKETKQKHKSARYGIDTKRKELRESENGFFSNKLIGKHPCCKLQKKRNDSKTKTKHCLSLRYALSHFGHIYLDAKMQRSKKREQIQKKKNNHYDDEQTFQRLDTNEINQHQPKPENRKSYGDRLHVRWRED